MKTIRMSIVLILSSLFSLIYAQIPQLDFTKPDDVLTALIYVSKSNDFAYLRNICHPVQKPNQADQVRDICLCLPRIDMYHEMNEKQEDLVNFIGMFSNIEFDSSDFQFYKGEDGAFASIEVRVTGSRFYSDVKVVCLKEGRWWYLFSFQ